MKKLSLILGSLALVLGLAQCNKPTQPVINLGEGVDTHIVFTTGGDNGAKGDYEVNALNGLDYKWAAGDVIKVYAGTATEFTSYVGDLTVTAEGISEDGKTATFENTLTVPAGAARLRFVHYGSLVAAGSNTSFETQSGVFNNLKLYVIGIYESAVVESGEYSGNLTLPYSIVKLDVSAFGTVGGSNVTVKNANYTTMNVSTYGDVTFNGGTTITLTGVKNTTTETYMMVAPGNTTLKFSGNGKDGSKAANIAANNFYTNNGASYVISARDMFIRGAFRKNAAGAQVEFTRANLICDNGNWTLPYYQYDFYTGPGGPYCMNSVYHADGGPDNVYGSFAWSIGTGNNYGITTSGDYLYAGTGFVDWGPNCFGNSSYTLTGEEFQYVLNGRPNCENLRRFIYLSVAIDIHVAGYVILPDATQNPETVLAQFGDGVSVSLETFNNLQETYGMVFLPSVGSRSPNNSGPGKVTAVGGYNCEGEAWFWTNSVESDGHGDLPMYYHFRGANDYDATNPYAGLARCSRGVGYGVRLVRDYTSK